MAAQRQGLDNETRKRTTPNANESDRATTGSREDIAVGTDFAQLSCLNAESRRRNWLETINKNRFLTVPSSAAEEGLVGLQFLASSVDWDQLSADGEEDNTLSDESGGSMTFEPEMARSSCQSEEK